MVIHLFFPLLLLHSNIRSISSIYMDRYEEFIKSSQNYVGEQYPEATTKDDLDVMSTNCFSHQDDKNVTYMKCGEYKACFVAAILTFEAFSDVWTTKQQHRGCWPKTSLLSPNCSSSCVFNTRQRKIQLVTFCSCVGSLCNEMDFYMYQTLMNLTHCHLISATSPAAAVERDPSRSLVITIAISSATLLFIVSCIILFSCLKQKDKRNTCAIELTHTLGEGSNNLASNLDDLLHGNLIHLGYYSAIRLGKFGGRTVAVKSILPKCFSQFDNEVDIFRILGEHPNIAKFFSCDRPPHKGTGIILLQYYQAGSLLNFIRHHSLIWVQVMRISHSVLAGLTYLHKEVEDKAGNAGRPGVAHRDLNTRNILMKLDGTCVLADFGFAVKLFGKPPSKYHIPIGSPRYMAPEILLRVQLSMDWKESLRKVDIYALGLVLWEVCRSCHEIYMPGTDLPACVLPYEEELSMRPSLSKVKNHVCDEMLRPKIPEHWDLNNSDLCSMKTIIQECWQPDAEARPEADELFIKSKLLLDAAMETCRKTYSHLHFKPRETRSSMDELVYHETSHSPLMSYNNENVVPAVPLSESTTSLV